MSPNEAWNMNRRDFVAGVAAAAAADRSAWPRHGAPAPSSVAEQPTSASYTVRQEAGIVYGVNCATGKTEYKGKNARQVINELLIKGLRPGRTWKQTVVLKGPIDLDLGPASWDARRRSGIEVPNYTRLLIEGKVRLVDGACTAPKQVNHIITNHDHKTGRQIEIVGGQIDGNSDNNEHGVYGVQVSGVTDVRIAGMYIHHCRETGIAFENVSRNCWAVNNHVVGRKELKLFWQDGLGNQWNCHNIFYFGNVAERCRYWGIYIEGGTDIVAWGNICRQNAHDGIIVGSGACRGKSISVGGNVVLENDWHGIHVHSADVERVLIYGNIVKNNAGGGRRSGIAVNSRDVIVQGNSCWDDRQDKKQEYGVALLAGAEHCQVLDNNVRGNKLAGVLLEQAARDCQLHDNQGYRTESKGTAKGKSPIAVRHGLAKPPSGVQLTACGSQPVALCYEADETEIKIWHNADVAEIAWQAAV